MRDRLVVWQEELTRVGGDGLARVGRESLHVTLCFLGSRPEEEIPLVAGACDAALAGASAPGLALGDVIWLPGRRRPRVLALRVIDGAGMLGAVQGRLAGALSALGVYPEFGRAFLPHVTVCRVRSGARRAHDGLPAAPSVVFDAQQVTLLRSHLGRGPARYEALHAVKLRGR